MLATWIQSRKKAARDRVAAQGLSAYSEAHSAFGRIGLPLVALGSGESYDGSFWRVPDSHPGLSIYEWNPHAVDTKVKHIMKQSRRNRCDLNLMLQSVWDAWSAVNLTVPHRFVPIVVDKRADLPSTASRVCFTSGCRCTVPGKQSMRFRAIFYGPSHHASNVHQNCGGASLTLRSVRCW